MNVEPVGVARLDDHALKFSLPCEYLGKGFASADPEPGKTVWGYLYKIDRASLFLLDIMEWAVLNQYRRIPIKAKTLNGEEIEAKTYQAKHAKEGLLPATGYKEAILRAARSHDFPPNYLEEIEQHPSRGNFALDPGFSLLAPSRRRLFENALRRVYLSHDKIREIVCDKLRF